MWITLRCDLRPSSTRRLDLRSASDARVTKTAFAVHKNARFAGFTKKAWGAHVVLHETAHYVGVTKNTQNPYGAATPGETIERGPHENPWVVCDVHFLRMQVFAIIRVMSRQMIYPDECYAIRGAVYEVYRELGSGFREEVYQQWLRLTSSKLGLLVNFGAYPKAVVEQWAN